MATFHFDLVSPESLAFSGEVEQVDLPGLEGDLGILAGHSPLVAELRPGLLTVTAGGKKTRLVVLGGVAEVSEKGLTVLAETATDVASFDVAAFAERIGKMEAELKAPTATGQALDRAFTRLDHFKQVHSQVQSTALH